MHEVYLDNAATTRVRPEVIEVMTQALRETYGNASSIHAPGKRAKELLEASRAQIAEVLDVDPSEVYFTSGGTESNNLAIAGCCRARGKDAGQIITSTLEHPAVTRSVRGLKREGWQVSYVDAIAGDFDLDQLAGFLAEPTSLITVMSVQNELGYRMPITEIVRLKKGLQPQALVHTDAVQAFGKFTVHPHELGVDLMTMSAHKIGGPKGIGALFVARDTHMFTTAFGGGQERGLRSGTEAVFLAAGFAEAVALAAKYQQQEEARIRKLFEYARSQISAAIPQVIINSRDDGSPWILNISIPGAFNQRVLDYLSDHGVYVSKASACTENAKTVAPGTWRPKHPLSLQAAGIPLSQGKQTLRISFAYDSTIDDVDVLVRELTAAVEVISRKKR